MELQPREVRVAAAIIFRDGRVLACQRADTEGAGGWELPGGKIARGESPEAACRREVAEELGVELGVMFYYDTVEADVDAGHMVMDCFVCGLAADAEPRATVHRDMRWLDRDDLLSVDWLPADKNVASTLGVMWNQVFSAEHL